MTRRINSRGIASRFFSARKNMLWAASLATMSVALTACVAVGVSASLPGSQAAQGSTIPRAAPAGPIPIAPVALTPADAKTFIDNAERQLTALGEEAARASWVRATFITFDTQWLEAKTGARLNELSVKLAKEAARFDPIAGQLDADTNRKLHLLKIGLTLPAPDREGAAQELSDLATKLDSTYSTGKFTYKGKQLTLDDATEIMANSRNPEETKAAWVGWHSIAPPMRQDYADLVKISNEGARELGFKDVGDLWRAGYDMPAAEFSTEVDRLWIQVKPLYNQLHCYVRAELNTKYGDAVQRKSGPIRADLLGNMWAQEWGNIYPLVAPKNADAGIDLTARLVANHYDAIKMVKTGEGFFSSLGFEPLPATFWERSQITRPRDREVVCHASAWDLDNVNDIRIKMCTKITSVDFQTIHHELGHNYYQRAYNEQPIFYRNGANDGFHEAIGDMIALSITPAYLKGLGLIKAEPDSSKDIGLLMKQALDKVAFLPFGLLIDKWRWQVFSGEVKPENYNAAWWKLRREYQGVEAPVARSEADFDPGAKYHIPGNTPYMRYFLARILQFQFYKAACDQAGWKGPLHRCTFFGNKEMGAKFEAMLKLGASKPWPDALEAFTGSRQMDGGAMVEYFAPLQSWLEVQNKGRSCGW